MKTTPNKGPKDPTHPFNRASYYVESIKWGDRWRDENQPPEMVSSQPLFERLLEDAGPPASSAKAAELLEQIEHYAQSWSIQTGISIGAARSLFMDGVMHGIAFASGLREDPPSYYEEQS